MSLTPTSPSVATWSSTPQSPNPWHLLISSLPVLPPHWVPMVQYQKAPWPFTSPTTLLPAPQLWHSTPHFSLAGTGSECCCVFWPSVDEITGANAPSGITSLSGPWPRQNMSGYGKESSFLFFLNFSFPFSFPLFLSLFLPSFIPSFLPFFLSSLLSLFLPSFFFLPMTKVSLFQADIFR